MSQLQRILPTFPSYFNELQRMQAKIITPIHMQRDFETVHREFVPFDQTPVLSQACDEMEDSVELVCVSEAGAGREESMRIENGFLKLRLARPADTETGITGCSSSELVAHLRENDLRQMPASDFDLAATISELLTTAMAAPAGYDESEGRANIHLIGTGAMNPPTPMHVIRMLVALAKIPVQFRGGAVIELAPDGELYLEWKQLDEERNQRNYGRGHLSFLERVILLRRIIADLKAIEWTDQLAWVNDALDNMQITDRIPSHMLREDSDDQHTLGALKYPLINYAPLSDHKCAVADYRRRLQLRPTEFAGAARCAASILAPRDKQALLDVRGKAKKLEAADALIARGAQDYDGSLFRRGGTHPAADNGELKALRDQLERTDFSAASH